MKRSSPSSYRPISLTYNIGKAMEHIVKAQIQNHLEEAELITEAQHGFRRRHSCLTQLLEHHNYILDCLEKGTVADVIYLYFAKAFDKVYKDILTK